MNARIRISRRIDRFLLDERGTVLTELVIYLPLLLWGWIALFVFWDAYSQVNVAQKATFSIADMITREQSTVDNTYIGGLRTVFAYMTDNKAANVKLRVTSVLYNSTTKRYESHWSYSPDAAMPALTTSDLQSAANLDRLPIMAGGDYLMLIETRVNYVPLMSIPFFGDVLKKREIKNYVATRPRFGRICRTGYTCS